MYKSPSALSEAARRSIGESLNATLADGIDLHSQIKVAHWKAIQRGVQWLKTNKRESGRWFTRSVNNDKYHFIANAGSAYAVVGLRACDAFSID